MLWIKATWEDETVHNSPVWPEKDMWKPESWPGQLESTLSQGKEMKSKARESVTTTAQCRSTWQQPLCMLRTSTTHAALLCGFPHCANSEISDTSTHWEGLFDRLGYFNQYLLYKRDFHKFWLKFTLYIHLIWTSSCSVSNSPSLQCISVKKCPNVCHQAKMAMVFQLKTQNPFFNSCIIRWLCIVFKYAHYP